MARIDRQGENLSKQMVSLQGIRKNYLA